MFDRPDSSFALKFQLPKIYAVTNAEISGLSHVEQVEALIAGGIKIIQLREKHLSPRDFFEAAKPAIKLAREYRVKMIINDRVDIAMALDADGVHLGQDDLSPEHARKILGPDAMIGFSTHSIEQAVAAMHLPVDYLAVGPIFSTSTKEKADPVIGTEVLRVIKQRIAPLPLVAIGGINRGNILDVLTSGADSAAIIGGLVTRAGNITVNAKELISLADTV